MPSEDIAVSVRNLTKTYRLFGHPADRIKQFLSFGLKRYHCEFTALKDVSFEVQKGETVGIIGRNGSGKSTLLQLICGILKPTSGKVHVNGRISVLLELGAGFNPEFTGRENVHFQGALMGLNYEEMESRFDDVAAFADIGEFIDQPVRSYSSGMFVRLAFAAAVHVNPDILIVNEALSVGDVAFQGKSMLRMQQMIDAGCSLILVSHDLGAIKHLCKRTLHLDHGSLQADGDSGPVCDNYVAEQLVGSPAADPSVNHAILMHRTGGRGDAQVQSVVVNPIGNQIFAYGHDLVLHVHFLVIRPVEMMVVSFYVKDAKQLEVLGTSTAFEGMRLGPLKAGDAGCVEFRFRNPLRAGTYSVTAILADDASDTRHYYDWVDHACHFESHDPRGQTRWAIACPEVNVRLLPANTDDRRLTCGAMHPSPL